MSRRTSSRKKSSNVNPAALDAEHFTIAAINGHAKFEFIVVVKKPESPAAALRAAIEHLCESGIHDDGGAWSLYVAGFQPNGIPLETSNVVMHTQPAWQQR